MDGAASHAGQVIDQFSRQAESYSRLTTSIPAGDRRAAFLALVAPQPDDLVLDVCCGPGYIALNLAPFVAHATGLDLVVAMLDQARAAQARAAVSNVTWVEGDVCALPFEDAAFSIVVCGAAFHHLADPVTALGEMARVCRSGGRIVVRDLTPAADKSSAYDAVEILRDPSHVHALSPEELGALGELLPLSAPLLHGTVAADLSLEAVLATSFPQSCTIADIRAIFREDAEAGEDRLGFDTKIIDGELRVSYPMTIAIWQKT